MKKKPAHQNKKHLSNLLQVYKDRLRPPQASVEKQVAKVISTVVGLEISSEQVSYTVATKTIKLSVPSLLRTEIKAKEMEIRKQLKTELAARDIPELFI